MVDTINDNTPLVSLATAADIMGVHQRTLMMYELEGLVIPKRNPQNRRLYSQNDIKKIRFIRYLTQKKKLNFAGIRIVFKMMKKTNPDTVMSLFPDFTDTWIKKLPE